MVRVGTGVLRFGLPGLLLGVSIAWISGARAPEAMAQTRSNGGRAGDSGARPGPPTEVVRRRLGRLPGEIPTGPWL